MPDLIRGHSVCLISEPAVYWEPPWFGTGASPSGNFCVYRVIRLDYRPDRQGD